MVNDEVSVSVSLTMPQTSVNVAIPKPLVTDSRSFLQGEGWLCVLDR